MSDPKPLDPLTRYREIERAARKTRAAQQFGTSESVLQSLYALQCAYESTPDPDIALVPVRRIRTEEGEPSCHTKGRLCPMFYDGGDYLDTCLGIGSAPVIHSSGKPHPDCPVWKEEGK